jgi:amino acid permease
MLGFRAALAVATLVGVIVGAGIFGLPFAVSRAGFFVGAFYIFGLGLVITLIHLAYGEIILRTSGSHRLVGYAAMYLGRWARPVIFVSSVVSLEGALLAYTILGGKFLAILAGPWWDGSPALWSLVFFAIGALVVWRGLRLIGELEFILNALLIVLLILLVGAASPFIREINLAGIGASPRDFFLPFGITLFALSGWAAIPELREFFPGRGKGFGPAILTGTLIAIMITLVFVMGVVGSAGSATTVDALSGLAPYVGQPAVWLGALFGLIAVATSFFGLGLGAKQLFHYDFMVPEALAWLAAVGPPLIIFLYGTQNLILILGVVGSLSALIEGSAILFAYLRVSARGVDKPAYTLNLPAPLVYTMVGLLAIGTLSHFLFV